MQSLSRGCATFVAEFVQKLQSLWQSELRLAESAAESLRVCRVCAESQQSLKKMRVRENVPDSLETSWTFLPEKIQKLFLQNISCLLFNWR